MRDFARDSPSPVLRSSQCTRPIHRSLCLLSHLQYSCVETSANVTLIHHKCMYQVTAVHCCGCATNPSSVVLLAGSYSTVYNIGVIFSLLRLHVRLRLRLRVAFRDISCM